MAFSVYENLKETILAWAPQLNGIQSEIDSKLDRYQLNREEPTLSRWIDGNIIYRKVINFGALPNATTKTMNTNFNFSRILKVSGMATNGEAYLPLPWPSTTAANTITLHHDSNNRISVTTGINYSAYTDTYVFIEYIK